MRAREKEAVKEKAEEVSSVVVEEGEVDSGRGVH